MANDPHDGREEGDGGPRKWPLYVRVLAVSYVLSKPGQWVIAFGLVGTALLLYEFRHPLDGLLIGLVLSCVACIVVCDTFRWWFPRWGRKHWPPTDDDSGPGRCLAGSSALRPNSPLRPVCGETGRGCG